MSLKIIQSRFSLFTCEERPLIAKKQVIKETGKKYTARKCVVCNTTGKKDNGDWSPACLCWEAPVLAMRKTFYRLRLYNAVKRLIEIKQENSGGGEAEPEVVASASPEPEQEQVATPEPVAEPLSAVELDPTEKIDLANTIIEKFNTFIADNSTPEALLTLKFNLNAEGNTEVNVVSCAEAKVKKSKAKRTRKPKQTIDRTAVEQTAQQTYTSLVQEINSYEGYTAKGHGGSEDLLHKDEWAVPIGYLPHTISQNEDGEWVKEKKNDSRWFKPEDLGDMLEVYEKYLELVGNTPNGIALVLSHKGLQFRYNRFIKYYGKNTRPQIWELAITLKKDE